MTRLHRPPAPPTKLFAVTLLVAMSALIVDSRPGASPFSQSAPESNVINHLEALHHDAHPDMEAQLEP